MLYPPSWKSQNILHISLLFRSLLRCHLPDHDSLILVELWSHGNHSPSLDRYSPPPRLPSVYPATSCASKVIGMVFVSPNRTWAPQGHKCCKQNPSCLQIYLIASNTAWLIILPLRIESFNECINIERMLAYKMGKELENQIPAVIQKHWAEGWVIMDFSHLGEGFWVIMTRQKWN